MKTKIVALCAFRNAREYIPGLIDCLRDKVDGAIFLDDGSTDRGREIVVRRPAITLIDGEKGSVRPPHSREIENRKSLLLCAIEAKATHVLCLDADERPEKLFMDELRRFVGLVSNGAITVQVRDLWNDEQHYRTDGIWSRKRKMIVFPLKPFTEYYPVGTLHHPWIPPTNKECYPVDSQFNLYHLGSLTPELRAARVAKFNTIDGEHKFQGDYDYLANEEGLTLEAIPTGRGWK